MNKKHFWSLIGVATLFSLWFSYTYFDKAIPFVHLSITMNKKQAEEDARCLARKFDWKVQDFDEATQFEENGMLQNFTELEGGGKQAFVNMLEQGHHQPFLWQVRFFKEKEIFETHVWFTPNGKPYGFSQKLPEDQAGNNISKSKAQKIAEDSTEKWDVDFKPYKLVEYEEQVRPSQRVDHTFTYERDDISLQKGLYRLQITVSGDEVTSLKRYVKIPDEFVRRYTEMRSLNILITIFGQGSEVVLYLFVIALFAFFFLYRRRYFLVSQTTKMMMGFGGLIGLSSLNQWPLVWNQYVTTVPKSMFVLQQLGQILLVTIAFTLFVGFICLVTEAMGRYVFKNHVQWFRLANMQVIGSYTVAEQVILGYCGAAIMLAFMFSFYMVAHTWGWWTPLQNKVNPNILSSYFPFFSPVVMSFQAGFWEEFSSRGLPIAGVLLLTRNWKNRNFWFWTMIIVQALLFGAAHANYPMQPAYYRIVEIFVPSLGFAWLYYTFGLLPGIITHMVYDSVYFLIPVFTSNLWFQKLLGVMVVGIPLWIVIARWFQQGGFKTLSKQFYNEAWESKTKLVEEKKITRKSGSVIPEHIKKYVWIFGVVGLLLFVTSKSFRYDTPPLMHTKEAAEKIAQQAIQEKFGNVGQGWTTVSQAVDTTSNEGNKFIWQEYGKDAYQKLQGSYVIEPYYSVKLIKFEGPVEERAEEYGAWISAKGVPLNIWHKLPEAAKGADISESKAQKLAYDEIEKRFSLENKDVNLVSSDSVKHENRRDWTIVFQDTNFAYEKGQARLKVVVAGDQVVEAYQYVYAPEEWRRAEQERAAKNGMIQMICGLLKMLFYMFFLYIAFAHLGFAKQLLRRVGMLGLILFVISIVAVLNNWNALLFSFNTATPFMNYLLSLFMSVTVSALASAVMSSVLIVYALWLSKKGSLKEFGSTMLTGVASGCAFIGSWSVLDHIEPLFKAYSPEYALVNFNNPVIGILHKYFLANVMMLFVGIATLLIVKEYLYSKYKNEYLGYGLFVLAGIVSSGTTGIEAIWFWLLVGFVIGSVWYVLSRLVFVRNIELLLITASTITFLGLFPSMFYGAYPAIVMDVFIAGLTVALVIPYIYRKVVAT